MPPEALALALSAAFLHAFWNLLIARSEDTQAITAVALVASVVVFAPVTVLTWHVETAAIPYILASGAFELAYIALLTAAYERVPLSIVYPVARGTAPVLVLIVSGLALGLPVTAPEIVGVVAVGVGVMLVRGLSRDVPLRTLGLPLAVAGTITGYTLIDRYGIRHAAAIPYFELTAMITLLYVPWVAMRRGLSPLRAQFGLSAVLAGAAMFGAYCLVLAALRIASPGAVAAVRESSVVIATALAAGFLGERVSRMRLCGAGLVAVGVATLALT
jgi:drug/metabolite transporter (DMT)-like permease